MRSFASHRGSALLVVLGMLAFMVVSAVAFSAYMRRARLPSNYLRRATSSRELVKAALARAIDDIDHAVNDNPHPGLGTQICNHRDENTGTSNTNRNGWVGRVFMNRDMSNNSTTKDNAPSGAADPNDTVSVLSLEGLAYVPAPLQGEARYYSRRTPTAEWHSFDFDAGRYAYFALDVSDYFDVNRMFANEPRSSAANTRITLSYLLENGNGGTWDSFLKSGTPAVRSVNDDLNISFSGSCVPLTSVADMNLLLGSSSCGPFKSWFYEYYNKGKGSLEVGSKPNDDENPRLMPLITDACFITNDVIKTSEAYSATWSGNGQAGDPYDLASAASQPFKFTDNKALSFGALYMTYRNQLWHNLLSFTGLAALCDYLDPDHIPTSLAIPTVERVPMICGFKLANPAAGKIGLERDPASNNNVVLLNQSDEKQVSPNPPTGPNDTRDVMARVVYRLSVKDFQFMANLQAVTAFPFAHKDDKDSSNWTLDGRLALFFTDEKISNLRTGSASEDVVLKLGRTIDDTKLLGNGLVNVQLMPKSLSYTSGNTFDNAFNTSEFTINGVQPMADLSKLDFLTVEYRWTQKTVVDPNSGFSAAGMAYKWDPEFTDSSVEGNTSICKFTLGTPILNTAGQIKYKNGEVWEKPSKLPLEDLRLNAALWLRVLDSGNVVDMVPACIDDDKEQLSDAVNLGPYQDTIRGELGKPYPLMLLDTAGAQQGMAVFKMGSISDLNNLCSTSVDVALTDNTFLVPDPRFNYAPEDWIQQSGTLDSTAWKTVNNGAFNPNATGSERGEDIYFATSDAGYLQNLYELSNLPYITNLKTGNGNFRGTMETPDGSAIPTSFADTCHKNLFWQNYDLMLNDPINVESNLLFHTSYQGQRVNPYSDNREVIRAVFANTPLDWKRASTNTAFSTSSECAGDYFGNAAGFNKSYTWSDNSPEANAKITREELEDFAQEFINQIQQENKNANPKAWDVILADLIDDTDPKKLGGIELGSAKLYKSDRDFLYGYWRDCFAARQQLYLIFVRAEPLMLGGSSPGATPPQLGGRAVALVWRDPTAVGNKGSSTCSGYPHPTRVLFYKNLE